MSALWLSSLANFLHAHTHTHMHILEWGVSLCCWGWTWTPGQHPEAETKSSRHCACSFLLIFFASFLLEYFSCLLIRLVKKWYQFLVRLDIANIFSPPIICLLFFLGELHWREVLYLSEIKMTIFFSLMVCDFENLHMIFSISAPQRYSFTSSSSNFTVLLFTFKFFWFF